MIAYAFISKLVKVFVAYRTIIVINTLDQNEKRISTFRSKFIHIVYSLIIFTYGNIKQIMILFDHSRFCINILLKQLCEITIEESFLFQLLKIEM